MNCSPVLYRTSCGSSTRSIGRSASKWLALARRVGTWRYVRNQVVEVRVARLMENVLLSTFSAPSPLVSSCEERPTYSSHSSSVKKLSIASTGGDLCSSLNFIGDAPLAGFFSAQSSSSNMSKLNCTWSFIAVRISAIVIVSSSCTAISSVLDGSGGKTNSVAMGRPNRSSCGSAFASAAFEIFSSRDAANRDSISLRFLFFALFFLDGADDPPPPKPPPLPLPPDFFVFLAFAVKHDGDESSGG